MKLFLAILLSLTACISTFAVPVKPILYKASKDGLDTYLLGTYHLGVSWDDFPSYAHDIFDKAEVFAMETDLTKVIPEVYNNYLYYSDGDSLQNYISQEAWSYLLELFPEKTQEELGKMKAPVAIALIRQLLSTEKQAFKGLSKVESPVSLDRMLYERAKKSGKMLSFMESWVSQLEVINILQTPSMAQEYILTAADSLIREEKGQEVSSLQVSYINGDKEAVCDEISSMDAATMEITLFERNRNWIPVIDMIHYNYTDAFIAVGSGHFCGKDSVLTLLEKKGYTIEKFME